MYSLGKLRFKTLNCSLYRILPLCQLLKTQTDENIQGRPGKRKTDQRFQKQLSPIALLHSNKFPIDCVFKRSFALEPHLCSEPVLLVSGRLRVMQGSRRLGAARTSIVNKVNKKAPGGGCIVGVNINLQILLVKLKLINK